MESQYQELLKHLATVGDLHSARAVLDWDRETAMPPGGAEGRARQLATLSRLAHEVFTGEKTAQLLQAAAAEVAGKDYDSDEASIVRVAQQDYDEETRLPGDFVAELTHLEAMAHGIWAAAREESNFSKFQPTLEKMIDMMLQMADYLGYSEHPYDALLGRFERGMTTARVGQIFDEHKPELIALIAAIKERADRVDDAVLHQAYDVEKQKQFALEIIRAYGFDFERGVQAVAVHPFCTSFSPNDVRITTRFDPNWLQPALFGMLHEAGHGMYEQGVARHLENTPVGSGGSLGVHESQSRMWENIIGRSREFWQWALPRLKEVFPQQLGGVDLEAFYKAINRVQPSFIRVEADEATYNLHIMLRFEIEKALITREVRVADLPELWNSKFREFFGITPPNDREGVLQDVHWAVGLFGYFPTYALGNLLSAQYYNKALQEHPSIPDEVAQGRFDTLLGWLNRSIHTHGRKFTADELTQRVTGESIQSRDYIRYLQTKFGEVYGL